MIKNVHFNVDIYIQLAKKVFKLSQKGYTAAQIAEECNIEESEVKEILA